MNATAIAPGLADSAQPITEVAEQHLLLQNVSWDAYVAIGNALRDRPGLRLTYDRGRLEFMTTSPRHEMFKKWLARFIDVLCEELRQPNVTAGNMTFQRQDLARGLEPDDCFWIAHEPQMRDRQEWDAANDPPPDLGLEIEVSRSATNRMGIYAALGIPEVWRFDTQHLRVHLLHSDRTYRPAERSTVFPGIAVEEIAGFLLPAPGTDHLTLMNSFRAWVREQLAKNA